MIRFAAFACACLIGSVACSEASASQARISRQTVTYCTMGGTALLMDVMSTPELHPVPAVIYIHGGGWEAGDRNVDDIVNTVGRRLVQAGMVVATIDYRLAPKDPWPAQIQDARCAVRFLRANAGRFGVDPSRIASWGESAGGHLAAMLGTFQPNPDFDAGPYLDQSSRVQAVVDMYGPADLVDFNWQNLGPHFLTDVFGTSAPTLNARLRSASPALSVDHSDPPFLIEQGANDHVVAADQSVELDRNLRAAGVSSELVMVQNADHGFTPSGGDPAPSYPQLEEDIFSFLTKTLAVVG